ncbi:MAG: hypothetical protein MUC92_11275 [Fimbriimonadaceae bacterium]|nr:hypothetical protein [Fimbriimonadaceae bacterium]
MVRILVVDNAVDAMAPLALSFAGEAVVFEQCFSAFHAVNRLHEAFFDIVVSEIALGGEEIASTVATTAFSQDLMTQVIVFADQPTVRPSVELMKMGVFDVIEKARGVEALVDSIRNAVHESHKDRELVFQVSQN